MDSDSVRGIGRRRLLGWGGSTTAGVVAAGALLVGARPGHADPADPDIPSDTRPGGAYDRYVAKLAAEGRFSGVVLLSHHGRTVLSLSYGMADREKGIRNHEGVAFDLSSAGKPFGAVAVLQLAQQGKLRLSDMVGAHLKGYAEDIAEQVTIGSQVDAVRNLDKGSPSPDVLGKNPGRKFIAAPGDGGFATAPDLVRFAHALSDGTVLDRPYAELLTGAKIPLGGAQSGQPAPADASFGAYSMPVHIVGGQWVFGRAGADSGVGASWTIYPYTGGSASSSATATACRCKR